MAGGGISLEPRTRHRFTAIGFSGGTLEQLDPLATPYERPPGVGPGGRSEVQFGSSPVSVGGVTDACEPVFTMFVTFRLRRRPNAADQRRLAAALDEIESVYPSSPHGVLLHVAYGLAYFGRLRGGLDGELVSAAMPRSDVDPQRRALAPTEATGSAQVDEDDVLLTMRSDSLRQLDDVRSWLVGLRRGLAGIDRRRPGLEILLVPTSTRVMFTQPGMPRRVAEAAGLPFAHRVDPDAGMWLEPARFSEIESPRRHCVRVDRSAGELGAYFADGAIQALDHMVIEIATESEPPCVPGPTSDPIAELDLQLAALDRRAAPAVTAPANPVLAMGRLHGPGLDRIDVGTGRPTPKQHWTMFAPSVDHIARVRAERARIEASGERRFYTTRQQDFLVPPRRHRAFPLVELDVDDAVTDPD